MILSERIASLEQQLLAAQGQAQENFRLLGIATAAQEASAAAITTLTAERDEARTALATTSQELTAERESREATIAGQVIQRLAEAGPAPIARDPQATGKTEAKSETGLSGTARATAYFASRQPSAPATGNN